MNCRKQQAKQLMVTAVQALLVGRESSPKEFNKDQIQERPQVKASKPEPPNFTNVLVKPDGHLALALIDIQTQVGVLIDSKFFHLYCILTRTSEKKTLGTMIRELQGTIG